MSPPALTSSASSSGTLCLAPVCLAVSLPHQEELQANSPAELAICAVLCLLLCLLGLGRSWQPVTQAGYVTLGNWHTAQRRHWTEKCLRYSITTSVTKRWDVVICKVLCQNQRAKASQGYALTSRSL